VIHFVAFENTIRGQKNQLFGLGLSNEHSVKGIPVMVRQCRQCEGMTVSDIQAPEGHQASPAATRRSSRESCVFASCVFTSFFIGLDWTKSLD